MKYYKLEVNAGSITYHAVADDMTSCFWFQVGSKDWHFMNFNKNLGGWHEHALRIMDSDKIFEVTELEVLVSCGSLPKQQYLTNDKEEKE